MVAPANMQEAFVGSVTVGERGQVVIPIEAREKCGIEAGDKLLAFVHPAGAAVFFVKLSAAMELAAELQALVQPGAHAEAGPEGGER